METFTKLFERFLVFVYHCFDRIVIQGYLPLLTRPEHIVHFFRDVHGLYPITPQVLAKRTLEYRGWVEGYARNHKIPILKAQKGVSKEDSVRPYLQRMERTNQHGLYCIFTSMEMGSTFTSKMPQFPTEDPNYRIIRRVPSRFLHYYFYIRDPVIGPLPMCVGTYLPFPDDLLSEWTQLHRDRTPPSGSGLAEGRQRLPLDLGPEGLTSGR